MTTDDQKWRDSLIYESQKIEKAATTWGNTYRRRASFFHSVGTLFALLSAVVATVAGGTALTAGGNSGGIIALAAAVLAAISTALGPASRTEAEQGGTITNTILADAARVFADTVAPYSSQEEALRGFKILLDQRDGVVRNAPIEAPRTLKKVLRELEDLEKKREPPPRP